MTDLTYDLLSFEAEEKKKKWENRLKERAGRDWDGPLGRLFRESFVDQFQKREEERGKNWGVT